MSNTWRLSYLSLALFSFSSLVSQEEKSVIDYDTNRVTTSHIEANGVGYNQGYSSLEGFFIRPAGDDVCVLPFADVRGHIFNNGKPAANIGGGVRFLGSRIYGIYSYYDYRKTGRQEYHQVTVGLESLGKYVDYRINGYLPFGKDKSPFFNTIMYTYKGRNYLISRSLQFAMEGMNLEMGVHMSNSWWDLYTAFGPYVFTGYARHAVGLEARIVAKITSYVTLQVNTSYDTFFDTIIQGQLSVNFPFGGKKACLQNDTAKSAKKQIMLTRLLQPVDRNEIIVVSQKKQSY